MALTKYNFNSFDVTSAASKALGFNSSANGFATISPGSMVLIKTLSISSGSSTVSLVNGSDDVVLDSTYPIYLLKLINIHSSNNDVLFKVNFRDGGSSYDATKTTTLFQAEHDESDSSNRNLTVEMGVNPNDPNMNFLKKDYRAVMKAIDKKMGK